MMKVYVVHLPNQMIQCTIDGKVAVSEHIVQAMDNYYGIGQMRIVA